MEYLMTQIALCLALAYVIGLIIGGTILWIVHAVRS